MSTTHTGAAAPGPAPDRRGPWTRWADFWFAPADPTTLGFIRLVTGFMVLYVHLAYCFDLQVFFGPNGWYGLDFVNRERRETPTVLTPFDSWSDEVKGAHLPEYPHRRQAVMAWMRSLPLDRTAMDKVLKYPDLAQATGNETVARDLLAFPLTVAGELVFDPDAKVRHAQCAQLVKEKYLDRIGVKDFGILIPKPLADLPESGTNTRAEAAAELTDFIASLPAEPAVRVFVVNHLIEQTIGSRAEFLTFVRELPRLDPAERETRLDYMEYWNQERRYAYRTGSPIFSLWYHVTDPTGMAVAHGVILVVIFLFAIGFCTRVTSVLTWLAAASYIHRNQQVLFGMDTMMNILLIYLMIGNSGAALSVDRLIARYRAARNSIRRTGGIDAKTRAFLAAPPRSRSAGLALRLLQVHFCFIYMAAGLSKLKGGAWWNTNAYWDTLVNPEFTLVHYHWYEGLVRGFVQYRPAYQIAAAASVVFTFATELGLPFLVWTRARPYVVIMGLLLHTGVAVFMGLWIFSLMMMTMLLGYLPGCIVRERLFGTPSTDKLTVKVDRKSENSTRAAALAVAADFDGQITVADGPGYAVEANGKAATGRDAVRELFARLTWLKGLRWAARLPLVSKRFAGN